MGKLMPALLAILGLASGLGGGYALRPGPGGAGGTAEAAAGPEGGGAAVPAGGEGAAPAYAPAPEGAAGEAAGLPDGLPDFVRLSNQFVVPVVEEGRVASMVILSLTLEVEEGSTEPIFAVEPKLRDALLQVLFDHANAGGFRGAFTDGANLIVLRRALREAAQRVAGGRVLDVLIADIGRQDN